jgi:hypothetical protein
MRFTVLALLFLFVIFSDAPGQTRRGGVRQTRRAPVVAPKPPAPSFQLGARNVFIPIPDGMVEATSQSDVVSAFFKATEAKGNEVLAVHMPQKALETIKQGAQPDFSVYTKVSVQQALKSYDLTDQDFADATAEFEKSSAQLLNVDSPQMKELQKSISEGLSDVSGKNVEFTLDQPVNLGAFQKTPNVYSVLFLMKTKGSAGPPLLCGTSFMKVNQRLLFVYTYRKYAAASDVETLKNFTRQWTEQILSANKG